VELQGESGPDADGNVVRMPSENGGIAERRGTVDCGAVHTTTLKSTALKLKIKAGGPSPLAREQETLREAEGLPNDACTINEGNVTMPAPFAVAVKTEEAPKPEPAEAASTLIPSLIDVKLHRKVANDTLYCLPSGDACSCGMVILSVSAGVTGSIAVESEGRN
jgi:hypothetical protein